MGNTIQIRRGAYVDLPVLSVGELGFATDTKQFFIGDGTTNYEFTLKNQNSLSYNINISNYYEITRDISSKITNECWWTTVNKLQKIREVDYTYDTNGFVDSIITKQYNESGILIQTYTETITRDGNNEITSITGVLT